MIIYNIIYNINNYYIYYILYNNYTLWTHRCQIVCLSNKLQLLSSESLLRNKNGS